MYRMISKALLGFSVLDQLTHCDFERSYRTRDQERCRHSSSLNWYSQTPYNLLTLTLTLKDIQTYPNPRPSPTLALT